MRKRTDWQGGHHEDILTGVVTAMPPLGVLEAMRHVIMVALAELPLMIILIVMSPGLAVQPFIPGGFERLRVTIDAAGSFVAKVLPAGASRDAPKDSATPPVCDKPARSAFAVLCSGRRRQI